MLPYCPICLDVFSRLSSETGSLDVCRIYNEYIETANDRMIDRMARVVGVDRFSQAVKDANK